MTSEPMGCFFSRQDADNYSGSSIMLYHVQFHLQYLKLLVLKVRLYFFFLGGGGGGGGDKQSVD